MEFLAPPSVVYSLEKNHMFHTLRSKYYRKGFVQFNIMKGICLFLTLFPVPEVFAQSTYTLVGEVQDSVGLPLDIGNVYIYRSEDSTLITGTYIDEGKFQSPPLSVQNVIIKITSFGYTDYFKGVENRNNADTVSVGVLKLVPEVGLGPVEVFGHVPIFETDGTTTIINVDKTILSASLTPLEILKKSPGVLVDGSSVSVMGRGNAAIFHNGQKITVDQLNTIPVDQIVKFEIIKNPSSRYDSDAAAVILVITKNYYQEGINFQVRQALTYPPFMSNTGLGINYIGKKLSLNFNYGFTTGSTWNTRDQETERAGFYTTDMSVRETSKINGNIFSAGIGYDLDSTQKVTLGYSGAFNKLGVDVKSDNLISATEVTRYQVVNTGDIDILNNNLIVNYRKSLDTLGSNIFAGSQYTLTSIKVNDDIVEDLTINNIFQGTTERRINSENGFNIFAAQVDFEKYFSENTRLMGGVKYSSARTSGNFKMDNFVQNQWENDTLFSSKTQFDEDIYAAYTEVGFSFKSLDILTGLRYEFTDANGITTQQGQLSLNRQYQWVLPSVSLTKELSEKLKLTLSYTTAVGRPSYNDLDPKVFYIDSLTSKQGNPLLLPQIDHAVGATLNLGPMRLDFTYYRSFNAFKDIVREGISGPNSVTLYKENVDADRYYASLTVPFRNNVITSYLYYLVGWDKVIGEFGDFTQFNLAPTHYIYLYNSLKVKDLFNFELIGSYSSGRFDGIFKDISTYDLSLGLSREFFKKKLKCQLLANDVFFTKRTAGTYYIGDYAVKYLTRNSTQYLRLSMSYKFGRLKKSTNEIIEVGSKEGDRTK